MMEQVLIQRRRWTYLHAVNLIESPSGGACLLLALWSVSERAGFKEKGMMGILARSERDRELPTCEPKWEDMSLFGAGVYQ